MRLAVGVLCHNQFKNKRTGLFDECVESIRRNNPDVWVIADNGSTDGTGERLAHVAGFVGFPRLPGHPPGNTCGYGMNKLAATLKDRADIIVLSNDDIVWKPGAFDRLRNIWGNAPDSLKLVSGLVEPTFALPGATPWNLPVGTVDVGGEKLLVRRSVPGGAWTYRATDTPLIFPVSTFPGVDDVPACHKLTDSGFQVACVEVAEHAGVGQSTWGNASHDKFVFQTLAEVKAEYGLDDHPSR